MEKAADPRDDPNSSSAGLVEMIYASVLEPARYDDLMNRFGMDLPAAGFTLYIERIHKAQLERGNDV